MERDLFEYAESRKLKSMAEAEEGAGAAGIKHAVAAVLEVAATLGEFTSDDVRMATGECFVEPRAWGPVMVKAAKTGQIEATDQYRKGGRASSHNRPMRVWRHKQSDDRPGGN